MSSIVQKKMNRTGLLQAENSTFLEEIDSTSGIYEQRQGENSRLVKRMMEGEARLNQMTHAQLQHKQSLEGCQVALQAAQQAATHSSQLQQSLQRQVHQLQIALRVCSFSGLLVTFQWVRVTG